jgi:hypothetical protein
MSPQNDFLKWVVTVIEHIPKLNIVFFEQLSHLLRARMQELINIGDMIVGIPNNIKDYIYILNFSQLVY